MSAGQLPKPAHPSGEESAQGEPHSGPGQWSPDSGKTSAHRDLRGPHVLHQQRGQAGLLHDPRQDRILIIDACQIKLHKIITGLDVQTLL